MRGHPTFIEMSSVLLEGNSNIWVSFCTVIEVCHLHLVGVIISWLFIEQEHHDLSAKVNYLPLIRSMFPKTCLESDHFYRVSIEDVCVSCVHIRFSIFYEYGLYIYIYPVKQR